MNYKKSAFILILMIPTLLPLPALAFTTPCPTSQTICTVEVIARGKVQHVQYREDLLKLAVRMKLRGWAKNLKNGTVQFVFQGKPQDVNIALKKIKHNSFGDVYGKTESLSMTLKKEAKKISGFTAIQWTSGWYCSKEPHDITWNPGKKQNKYYSVEEANKIVYRSGVPMPQ